MKIVDYSKATLGDAVARLFREIYPTWSPEQINRVEYRRPGAQARVKWHQERGEFDSRCRGGTPSGRALLKQLTRGPGMAPES